MKSYDFIEPSKIAPALPRTGPFRLAGAWVRGEWLSALLWTAVLLALAALMIGLGIHQIRNGLRATRIWDHGVQATSDVGYDGDVTVHNFIGRSYDLEVFTTTNEGQPIEFEADFFRWFTGPGSGDPVDVRYLASDPSEAVLSWQADAVWHGYAIALMVLCFGGLGLWGAALILTNTRDTVGHARKEAATGRLVRAHIVERTQRMGEKGKISHVIRWEGPGGESGRHEWVKEKQSPLLIEGGAAVVVLTSPDTDSARSLSSNGWPIRL